MKYRPLKPATMLAIVVLMCQAASSQVILEKVILTDTRDSFILKASNPSFDINGNFCFEVIKNDKAYFLTGKDQTGGFKHIGTTYSSAGMMSYTYPFSYSMDDPWYYRNTRSTNVFGPVSGKMEKFMTSGTKTCIAMSVSRADTVCFYVNGQLVSKNLKSNLDKFDINYYEWCSFSENGNAIYYIKKDSLYQLFVNGKLIDESVDNFNELHINNNGDYTYAEGRRPKVKTNGYTYMFFVHTKDTVIGPVRTVWKNHLTRDKSYYYSGDDNGPDYIIINNSMQKGLTSVSNVKLFDGGNYFYQVGETGSTTFNVNGKKYPGPSSEILLPSCNKEGEFAFYSIKDYYLYKFINGRQEQKPITRYGVRPKPLYISPKGSSLHSFITDDSIYLYRDDTLLFKPIGRKSKFELFTHNELMSNLFSPDNSTNASSLFYIEYDTAGYWVFNGEFSKPMIPAQKASFFNKTHLGEIPAGELNDYGFFSIQRTGNSKFQINVNNKIYKELEGVDNIFEDSCYFDGKELIFYGTRELSVLQFKLRL